HALFQLDGSGVVSPGATFSLTSGTALGTWGFLMIRGGNVRLSDANWRLATRLEYGTFAFEGATPNVMGAASFVATGGDVVWRSTDTLLLFTDSTSVSLQGATVSFETRAVFTPTAAFLPTTWLGDVRFYADSAAATSLTLYGMNVDVTGAVSIVESATPPTGTAFDLIRLENGAVLSGSPTMATSGYTLQVNPAAGVGLRAVKN
ncbi:MAG: hypothetical protein PVH40_05115, partial [Gemmatimonadales bacterium]